MSFQYNLADRLDYVGTRMPELNDNSINYERKGESVRIIENVTFGQIDVTLMAAHGITLIEDTGQDFIFDTEKLSQFEIPTPLKGDRIIWDKKTFELMTVGEEIFTYTTASRKRVRVHTKQIE